MLLQPNSMAAVSRSADIYVPSCRIESTAFECLPIEKLHYPSRHNSIKNIRNNAKQMLHHPYILENMTL